MKNRSSRTAEYMAFFRALESARPEESRLFYDTYAHMFLHGWRKAGAALAHVGTTRHLMYRVTDRIIPGARAAGIARTAFLDAELTKLLPTASALVILGAGFDTRALRLPAAQAVPCYELDHPETHRVKRTVLSSVLPQYANQPHFVAIDFNKQSISEVLSTAGFDDSRPACFLWEGVTNYLEPEAVDATLREIARFAPGSTLLFTYVDAAVLAHPERFYNAPRLLAKLQRMGEPWTFGIDPAALRSFLSDRGLSLVSDIAVTQIWHRHRRRQSAIHGYEFYRIAIAKVGS